MIFKIVGAVFVLSVIVIFHELGHFLSAKSIGVNAREFAVGMGPAIWKKQGAKTLFSLRCLPFGGYCLFDPNTEGFDHKGRPLSMQKRGGASKIYILLAGPLMNFVLAAFLFTILFSVAGIITGFEAIIGNVQPDTPASRAGIMHGDRVISIAGEELVEWFDLSRILSKLGAGEALEFIVERNGETIAAPVTPVYNQEAGRVMIGVSVDDSRVIIERIGPVQGIIMGLGQTKLMIGALIDAIARMASGQISVSENLSGPVALVEVISESVANGLRETLFLMGFLSVNLGIMNLLPIPALDGGRIIISLIEAIRRKPFRIEVENWINIASFAILISIMIFLTVKDIIKILGS